MHLLEAGLIVDPEAPIVSTIAITTDLHSRQQCTTRVWATELETQ
jgi:hypothetical protein